MSWYIKCMANLNENSLNLNKSSLCGFVYIAFKVTFICFLVFAYILFVYGLLFFTLTFIKTLHQELIIMSMSV